MIGFRFLSREPSKRPIFSRRLGPCRGPPFSTSPRYTRPLAASRLRRAHARAAGRRRLDTRAFVSVRRRLARSFRGPFTGASRVRGSASRRVRFREGNEIRRPTWPWRTSSSWRRGATRRTEHRSTTNPRSRRSSRRVARRCRPGSSSSGGTARTACLTTSRRKRSRVRRSACRDGTTPPTARPSSPWSGPRRRGVASTRFAWRTAPAPPTPTSATPTSSAPRAQPPSPTPRRGTPPAPSPSAPSSSRFVAACSA